MTWISVKDKLPIQMPENWPTYNWVIVTSKREGTGEPWPFTIARYTKDGWDLWNCELAECPCFGDSSGSIDTGEITHWMEISKPEDL